MFCTGARPCAPAADETALTREDRQLLTDILIRIERIDATLTELKDSVDNRFEQIDKRFEQVDKRFGFMQNLMIGMLAVFGSLCGVFVGLLLWDRKTFMERAKEAAMRELEDKWRINDWIHAFRIYAQDKPDLEAILKKCHLL